MASPIDHVDISAVEPHDTPIWDELLSKLVPAEQHDHFPFDREPGSLLFPIEDEEVPTGEDPSGDEVKGNDDDGNSDRDERDDTENENPEADEGAERS